MNFSKLRFRQVIPYIPEDSIILDIGCGSKSIYGSDARFLKSIENKIKYGIGIDKKVKEYRSSKLDIRQKEIIDNIPVSFDDIPVENNGFDVIIMLAVFEHLKNPQKILNECYKFLRMGGG